MGKEEIDPRITRYGATETRLQVPRVTSWLMRPQQMPSGLSNSASQNFSVSVPTVIAWGTDDVASALVGASANAKVQADPRIPALLTSRECAMILDPCYSLWFYGHSCTDRPSASSARATSV